VYRGEIINDFCPTNRKPNPERMLEAYNHSMITKSEINHWNFYGDKSISNFKSIYKENKYNCKSQNLVKTLLDYYENFPTVDISQHHIFTSHEGLLLNYEECLLRKIDDGYYDLSGHFLWIGERTNNLNEAHVEFFRGVENPIGIKVGTRVNFDELIKIVKILNPENKKGKIVLITRFGSKNAESYVDILCKKVIESAIEVIFVCDPNHGNTKLLHEKNKKVRYFDDLIEEIIITSKMLQSNGKDLGGIHLEASSFDVTECIGGVENEVTEIDEESYTTYCDPRLNMQQAMELCDHIGKVLHQFDI
jgi:3-deoxy-7-phosphoheptulonate synthase